jgi:hypothetical protein
MMPDLPGCCDCACHVDPDLLCFEACCDGPCPGCGEPVHLAAHAAQCMALWRLARGAFDRKGKRDDWKRRRAQARRLLALPPD